ncbi:hypothetical protein M5M_14855 [Simiduia agarivorans SA1 = DSM 21679]|uniref:Uncharacterized protein n=2 Tax=Simiduia TaxID=447467 RepID=K4KPE4_SIMAS|nr:hypothetical protein M5M_14855 [Simiduia agarivorans SA1 = DSM 21679]
MFEFGKKPTDSNEGYLLILAPLKYEGWSINSLQYAKGKNSISVMQYIDESRFPGKAAFQITGTSDFFDGAKLTVSYTPDPVVNEDGTVSGLQCIHTQEVIIEI